MLLILFRLAERFVRFPIKPRSNVTSVCSTGYKPVVSRLACWPSAWSLAVKQKMDTKQTSVRMGLHTRSTAGLLAFSLVLDSKTKDGYQTNKCQNVQSIQVNQEEKHGCIYEVRLGCWPSAWSLTVKQKMDTKETSVRMFNQYWSSKKKT